MSDHEVEDLRTYHETRCQQQKRRILEAQCDEAARAHTQLLHLHRLMTIDLAAMSSSDRR